MMSIQGIVILLATLSSLALAAVGLARAGDHGRGEQGRERLRVRGQVIAWATGGARA
jgi:hypothetical protein